MEEASGQDLGWFFEQWLYKPGTLNYTGTWKYDSKAKQVKITLNQSQTDESLFRMPMEIGLYYKGQAGPAIERVQVNEKSNVFTFSVAMEPEDVRLDPNVWVLMEGEIKKGK